MPEIHEMPEDYLREIRGELSRLNSNFSDFTHEFKEVIHGTPTSQGLLTRVALVEQAQANQKANIAIACSIAATIVAPIVAAIVASIV